MKLHHFGYFYFYFLHQIGICLKESLNARGVTNKHKKEPERTTSSQVPLIRFQVAINAC